MKRRSFIGRRSVIEFGPRRGSRSPVPPGPLEAAQLARDRAPARLLRARGRALAPRGLDLGLALELVQPVEPLPGERPRLDRRADRAPRLAGVAAVAEAAAVRERRDVGERPVEAGVVPEPQLADPRAVHDGAARPEREEPPAARHV